MVESSSYADTRVILDDIRNVRIFRGSMYARERARARVSHIMAIVSYWYHEMLRDGGRKRIYVPVIFIQRTRWLALRDLLAIPLRYGEELRAGR